MFSRSVKSRHILSISQVTSYPHFTCLCLLPAHSNHRHPPNLTSACGKKNNFFCVSTRNALVDTRRIGSDIFLPSTQLTPSAKPLGHGAQSHEQVDVVARCRFTAALLDAPVPVVVRHVLLSRWSGTLWTLGLRLCRVRSATDVAQLLAPSCHRVAPFG